MQGFLQFSKIGTRSLQRDKLKNSIVFEARDSNWLTLNAGSPSGFPGFHLMSTFIQNGRFQTAKPDGPCAKDRERRRIVLAALILNALDTIY